MHGSLWQTVLFAPLLISAAPTLITETHDIEKRLANGAPDCAQLERKYGWTTDNAPWRQDTSKGDFFCASQWDKGIIVAGISAWKDANSVGSCDSRGPITNIQIRLSNHELVEIGTGSKKCSAAAVGLDGGVLIDKVEIWPSTDNAHAQGKTHLHLKSSNTDAWLKDDYTPKQGDPWTQSTGGGVLVAVTGYVLDGAIVQTNFHFTPGSLQNRILGPVVFDDKALNGAPVNPDTVTVGEHCNPHDTNITVTAGMTAGTFQTTTETKQDSNSYGFDIHSSMEVGVPGLAKMSAGWTFKFNHETMESTAVAKQNQETSSWTVLLPIPPHQIGACKLTAGKGQLDNLPYTQAVTLVFEDGSKVNVSQSGTMSGVVYSKFESACDSRPIDPNSASDKQLCTVQID